MSETGAAEKESNMPEGSEEELLTCHELLENMPALICRFLPDGTLTFVNREYCRYFQKDAIELIGRNFFEFIPEQSREAVKRHYSCLDTRKTIVTYVHQVIAPDGSLRWQQWTDRVVLFEDGKPKEFQSIGIDITDKKLVEEALYAEREKLFKILGAMRDGVSIVTADFEIEYVNSIVRQTFGELGGRRCYAYFHERDTVCPWCSIPDVMKGRTVRREHVNFRTQRAYDLLAAPLKNADGSISKLEIFRDITDRKRSEEELRAARDQLEIRVRERTAELEERAAQLARLTSELTLAEQRERQQIVEILHDNLQQFMVGAKIRQETLLCHLDEKLRLEAEHVLGLINESIKTSRSLSAELSPPILRSGDLSAALQWLARWMQENQGLRVDLQTSDKIASDREDLNILLFKSVRELLLNVLKHSGAKAAAVDVRHVNGELRIVVSDAGSGFDPETVWKDVGSGQKFGLISIRERLMLMGGSLEVESSPGRGAVFTLSLPLEKSKETGERCIRKLIAKIRKAKMTGEKIRVLLADDHTVVRQGLASMLTLHSDVEVVGEAADGEAAVASARTLQPDVILMDVSMPGMNGIEATRTIHAESPHIRIIGLSMHDREDKALQMAEAGASAYCTKDGATELLLAAIRGQADRDRQKSRR